MMTRDEILTTCQTNPDKIVQVMQTLFQRVHELETQVQELVQQNQMLLQQNQALLQRNQELEMRIQTLEVQGKKTVLIAICRLLLTGLRFRSHPA